MLTIRDKQMQVLGLGARNKFEDRMVAVAASDYPAAYSALEESGTRRLIAHAIELGSAHEIVTEGGVSALVALMIQYGEAFERSPDRCWAESILARLDIPGGLKVELLLQRMAARSQGRVIVEEPAK